MRSRFNIKTATEFVFTQMTKANTQSCNKFNSFMIFTFENIIWGWPDKIQVLFFKALKLPTFRMLRSRLFHSITAEGKKRIYEKVMFYFEKGYVFSISSGVRGLS